MRRTRLAAVLLAVLACSGCVEAEETWTLARKGAGEYRLTLRWNADLWRRVRGVLGAKVTERIAGNGFPLRPALWRDGLRDLQGVTITDLAERDTGTGLRELHLQVKFESLAELLRWEVLAGRRIRLQTEGSSKPGAKEPLRTELYMEPIARVPVLDRIAALVEATENPPPLPEGAALSRDPPPLTRMGVDGSASKMVWRMIKLPLDGVKIQSRFILPGDLVSRQGALVEEAGVREASFSWSFADLRRVDADRTIRLRWRPLAFDEFVALDRPGIRDPRPRAPDGSKK